MSAFSDPLSTDDFVLPFRVGESAVRGRVVRLSGVIDDILSRHPLSDPVLALIGQAACLVSMMGASLKFDGKLIFQAQGDGPVSLLVADFAASGALRAMAKETGEPVGKLSNAALLGKGHVVLTIDQGPDMERYQGITPLDGATLSEAAVSYFDQSEQIPTAIRLAVGKIASPGEPERWRAGGIMAQFVPGEGGVRERGEEVIMAPLDQEAWARAEAFVQSTQDDELLDPAISAETLLYRLFHEDGVRVYDQQPVRAECSCTGEKIEAVLSRYSEEELADMVEDGAITVTCEFCRRDYLFDRRGARISSASG
ncbi:MAG: Hsp33 family molecular chaperone [Pseudomonadota bacterium]